MPLRQIISQKVRKYRIFTIFVIDTFELGQNIRKQTKTRLYRRACLSWLGCVGETRAELLEIGQVIDDIKKKSIIYSNDFIRISSANLSMSVVHPLHQSKHSKN